MEYSKMKKELKVNFVFDTEKGNYDTKIKGDFSDGFTKKEVVYVLGALEYLKKEVINYETDEK